MPIDHVPYIGRLSPISRGTWVATGFQKWGLSAGTVAAMLITDEILGRGSEWRDFYNPARLGPLSSAPEFAKENAAVGMRFFGDRLRRPTISSAHDLGADQGGMLRQGTEQIGVYRDPEGMLHGVSLRCTHLGCLLAWNPAERSWDCPCHGSRFAHDGRVIEGPATSDLRAKPVPDA